MNPYNWQTETPAVLVERSTLAAEIARLVCRGDTAVLLGGRGTGKSVFLGRLAATLGTIEDVTPIHFRSPPLGLDVEAWLTQLERGLGGSGRTNEDAQTIVTDWMQRNSGVQLVLLYDEIEQFAQSDRSSRASTLRFFNNLEVARRAVSPRLGVLVAAGLGYYLMRDTLGSGFTSRARLHQCGSFDNQDLDTLASPFAADGRPLAVDVLQAIRLGSGGHAALVVFVLQRLWERSESSPAVVGEIIEEFRVAHREFVRAFQRSMMDRRLSEAPQAVFDLVARSGGLVGGSALAAACDTRGEIPLEAEDALTILGAAGLVRVEGSVGDDPVAVRAVHTVLSMSEGTSSRKTLGAHASADIEACLRNIHSLGPDFYQGRGVQRTIVPEATLSAMLAIALRVRGWVVEREAMHGAGRTDLKMSHPRHTGSVIAEVKLWGRNDYDRVHEQIEAYWSDGVLRGFAVMFCTGKVTLEEYEETCLAGCSVRRVRVASPISGKLTAERGGSGREVDHYVVGIPRR